jgi:hypothetical protein
MVEAIMLGSRCVSLYAGTTTVKPTELGSDSDVSGSGVSGEACDR